LPAGGFVAKCAMTAITLRAGDLELGIDPSLGGAISRFAAGDFPIFRETPATPASVSDYASFPLIPFSNRIRSGLFHFGGGQVQIPVDKRDPRFTNHGHTRHLPWLATHRTPASLSLRFTQSEPSPLWPFPFTAGQEFQLEPNRLTLRAWLRNAHTQAAPAGIGFHPYFTRLPDTALGFFATHVWETDALDIPVRSSLAAGRFDFTVTRPIEMPLINHAYGGWNGAAEIIHPGKLHLAIEASGAFDHLILFTPEGKGFFGFEPVSHRPDGFNPLPDPADAGIAVLAPGETIEGRMEITLRNSSLEGDSRFNE
jgi:aldose 1-epimerase